MHLSLSWLLVPLAVAGCGREPAVHERTAPLPSQAFVWQRLWKPEVAAAVRNATSFTALHVLAAEMTFKEGEAVTTVVQPDWQALQSFGGQVGAVLRIHASAAKTGWDEKAMRAVERVCAETVARFHTAGVPLGELQIDYDCPESRLGDYVRLVRRLKAGKALPPLRITALPAWQKQAALRDLAAESPGYVLQVHSLHLPSAGFPGSLTDFAETRKAVAQAAKLGVPFRVALPTYSCVVEFHADGTVKEVYGEDLPAGLANAPHHQVLSADAHALAALVEDWRQHAPEAMQAVIWYRLPVATDRLNWPASTLQKIVRGEPLKRGWKGGSRQGAEGQTELVLQQEGDAPDELPGSLVLEWQGGQAEAADGLQGYGVSGQGEGWLRMRLSGTANHSRAAPGQELVAGWIRLREGGGRIHIKILP